MKKTTISISSTTFLFPGNLSWKVLSDFYDLEFSNYSDWPNSLQTNAIQQTLWVVFLQDFYCKIDLSLINNNYLTSFFDQLMIPLKKRLMISSLPVVISYSTYVNLSPIFGAKKFSAYQEIYKFFRRYLHDLSNHHLNLYLNDLDESFACDGFKNCLDTRNYYLAHSRLSSLGIEILARTTLSIFNRINSPPKKVLILDCDDTLWGGVVGEVGPSNILLGQDGIGKAYQDFQRSIKFLASQGILLVISSKNNESDVLEVFKKNKSMILSIDDFVLHKINWNEKSNSIVMISNDLNLGLDTFVFLDDNPIEREKVRVALPMVTTPDLPRDVFDWADFIISNDYFASFNLTKEDENKNLQYKARSEFVNEVKNAVNPNVFLKTICMKPIALNIDSFNLSRAEQLCFKTNQFNLRTKRHDKANIMFLSQKYSSTCFLTSLTDNFGDHGITGLVIAKTHKRLAFLDTFLLSCRVLGRKFEYWMLNELLNRLKVLQVKYLIIQHILSSKNQVFLDFLVSLNLKEIDHKLFQENELYHDILQDEAIEGKIFLLDVSAFDVDYMEVFSDK
jgi:FkbH-like protein